MPSAQTSGARKRSDAPTPTLACVRVSPSEPYLLHHPIPPPHCHLRRAPSASPSPRPLCSSYSAAPISCCTRDPCRPSDKRRRTRGASNSEGPDRGIVWMSCRLQRDDAADGGEERYNTRSTFKTSKYNSCNIRLKVLETLKNT
jgi:hypothetical protein